MLGIKSSPNISKSCKKVADAVITSKSMDFKIAKMAAKHLGIFYIKICRQELYKFAQSGHTVGYSNIFNQSKYINNGKEAPMTCQRMMYDVTKSNESEL